MFTFEQIDCIETALETQAKEWARLAKLSYGDMDITQKFQNKALEQMNLCLDILNKICKWKGGESL